jgi:hypothetical protein
MIHRRSGRAWLIALAFFAVTAWPLATAADPFAVSGIKVDVTDESAAAARVKAISEAERKGFVALVTRLAGDDAAAGVASLSDAQVSRLVRDIAVESEKVSTVRYIASLTIRFKPDSVRSVLADRGITFSLQAYTPVVVVPVFESGGDATLWDDPNPWRRAWDAHPRAGALVPVTVPSGDLTDLATINASQAIGGDVGRLMTLVQHYRAGDAVVSVARLETAAGGASRLRVSTARYTVDGRAFDIEADFAANPGEPVEALMARAVEKVAADLQERLRERTARRVTSAGGSIQVTVWVAGIDDWLSLKRKLEANPLVRSVSLVMLARDRVRISVSHIGEVEQLANALSSTNLILEQGPGGWRLRRGGDVAAGGT